MDFSSILKLMPSRTTSSDDKRASEAAASEPSNNVGEPSSAANTSPSLEQRLAGGASKTASDALAAAADKPADGKAEEVKGRGRAIDATAPAVAINLDDRIEGESLSQLEGTTITRYVTELAPEQPKLIAVSAAYITYGLQKGHIRVLHRQTGKRALLKDHESLLSDLRFFDEATNNLASACLGGKVVVRRLSLEGEEVQARLLLSLQLLQGTEPVGPVRISWHPTDFSCLAVGAADVGLALSYPALTATGESSIAADVSVPVPGTNTYRLQGKQVKAVAFSPDGLLLALGTSTGEVQLVSMTSASEFTVHAADGVISSLTWVADSSLLVGSQSNTQLSLWRINPSQGLELQQSVDLRGRRPALNSLEFVAAHSLVLLANARGSTITTLQLDAAAGGFTAAAQFEVTMPVYSLEPSATPQNGTTAATIQVFTVQSQAIQQYTLRPAHCQPAASSLPPTTPGTPLSSSSLQPRPNNDASQSALEQVAHPQDAFAVPPSIPSASTATSSSPPTAPPELPVPTSLISSSSAPPIPTTQPTALRDASAQPDALRAADSAPLPMPTAGLQGSNLASMPSLPKVVAKALSKPPPPPQDQVATPLDSLPSTPAAETIEAVRQALQGLGSGEFPKAVPPPSKEEVNITSLGDLYERLQKDQRRQAQQTAQNLQQLQRTMREEIRRETKRLESATEGQIAKFLKLHLKTIAEERKALIAEERQNLEKLLVTISASINRDLPQRLEDTLVRELGSLKIKPAVQAALAESLPRELAGPALQASLDKSLRPALAKPLQDGFRSSFQQHVLPAFEAACRTMFTQVQATFAGGLAEHLQAAGGANAAVAASLRESLTQADALANKLSEDVRQGCRQLLDLASRAPTGVPAVPGKELAGSADARAEVSRLLEAKRYDDAFSTVLDKGDVALVTWLCGQVEPAALLGSQPPLLSQHVMLVLLQQLSYDLSQDPGLKLKWIKDLAVELDPQDRLLAPHMFPVLQSALTNLQRYTFDGKDMKAARFAAAVLESALQACKPYGA